MPAAAPLPQDVTIERWLGYPRQQRRVIHKPAPVLQTVPTPKNLLIDWNATNNTRVHQKLNFLGIEQADPESYERKYGSELTETHRLPKEADGLNSRLPGGEELSVKQKPKEYILEGDVDALNLVDRRKVNLNEYLIPKWLYK